MSGLTTFPKAAVELTFNPHSAWRSRGSGLQLGAALAWQLAGGTVCALLIAARLLALAEISPQYAGSGVGLITAAAVVGQLLGYALYIFGGAWIVSTLVQASSPQASYRRALELFSYSTFPLLAGWICRAAVAWVRPAPTQNLLWAADFRSFIDILWAAVALPADAASLLAVAAPLPAAILSALSLFWIWHAITLWIGLRISFGASSTLALLVVATLFGVMLAAAVATMAVGASWTQFVVWKN